jgi:glutamate 5-kinase
MYTVSTATLGSNLGTGGMETKLIAAEIATAAGVTTVICSSKHPERIFDIIEYNNLVKSGSSTPAEPAPMVNTDLESTAKSNSLRHIPVPRPPHTLFTPSSVPMRDLKSWTRHTLFPAGSVIIDAGAHNILCRRESGGRLLPAGVLGVVGAFASGQAVRIVIRRRLQGDGNSHEDARFLPTVMGSTGTETTRPSTPTLYAMASISSSVASLEPSSLGSFSPLAMTEGTEENEVVEKEPPTEDNLVEVGRGLANYNSAQINKVKGLNRYDNRPIGRTCAHFLQFVYFPAAGLC